MKTKSALRSFLFLAGSSLLAISYSHAATLYWDGATPAGPPGGGAGTWQTAGNWDTSPNTDSSSNWSDGNTAYFGGTAGTVTIDTGGRHRRRAHVQHHGLYARGWNERSQLRLRHQHHPPQQHRRRHHHRHGRWNWRCGPHEKHQRRHAHAQHGFRQRLVRHHHGELGHDPEFGKHQQCAY